MDTVGRYGLSINQQIDQVGNLDKWYRSQCNEEWEHRYGVTIQTLDNPGWEVVIDLTGTSAEGRALEPVREGRLRNNCYPPVWIDCYVEDNVFHGHGSSLAAVLAVFLGWAGS